MKTILIGETCIDKELICSHERMSPEDTAVPILKILKESSSEGMVQIVSKYLSKLALSHEVLTDIYSNVIKTRVFIDGKQIARIDEDNKASLSTFSIDYFSDNKFDNIIVSDYGKGILTPYLIDIINFKSSQGSKVFLDPHPNNDIFQYKNLFVLKLNQTEVEHFTKTNYQDGAHILRSKIGIEHVFVTLGKEGIYYVGPNGSKLNVASLVTSPRCVAGAGDVVFASVCNSLINNIDIHTTLVDSMKLVKEYME